MEIAWAVTFSHNFQVITTSVDLTSTPYLQISNIRRDLQKNTNERNVIIVILSTNSIRNLVSSTNNACNYLIISWLSITTSPDPQSIYCMKNLSSRLSPSAPVGWVGIKKQKLAVQGDTPQLSSPVPLRKTKCINDHHIQYRWGSDRFLLYPQSPHSNRY